MAVRGGDISVLALGEVSGNGVGKISTLRVAGGVNDPALVAYCVPLYSRGVGIVAGREQK